MLYVLCTYITFYVICVIDITFISFDSNKSRLPLSAARTSMLQIWARARVWLYKISTKGDVHMEASHLSWQG